jgi:pSer/pThr/pTyr-binding forkhead associated (FHA) protein
MTSILVFILRILMALTLYGFLGWALYTIWRELKIETERSSSHSIPALHVVLYNADQESEHTFTGGEVLIGRSSTCNFPIQNDTVSSQHTRLNFSQNQWWVEDLNSTNGTFLNNERLEVPTVIMSGDEIRCGQVVFVIHIEVKRK